MFSGDIKESKTSTELDMFDVHIGSEHQDNLLPRIHSHVLGIAPPAYTVSATGVPLWAVGYWWERESFWADLWH